MENKSSTNSTLLDSIKNINLSVYPQPQGELVDPLLLVSHSASFTLASCPRKFQLQRYTPQLIRFESVDTSYGKALGAAIADLIAGVSIGVAYYKAFISWAHPNLWEEKPRVNKSLLTCLESIDRFAESELADITSEWEIYFLPDGRPALELGYTIICDLPNLPAYRQRGFIDLVLCHKLTGVLAVVDVKSNGSTAPSPETYAESTQCLEYAIVIDYLSNQKSLARTLQVFYLTDYTSLRQWALHSFTKTAERRAKHLVDLHSRFKVMEVYKQAATDWPATGQCKSYSRLCEFYGTCDKPLAQLVDTNHKVAEAQTDVTINFTDLIKSQYQFLESNQS